MDKKAGRPPKEITRHNKLVVFLTDEEKAKFKSIADKWGMSMSELARKGGLNYKVKNGE